MSLRTRPGCPGLALGDGLERAGQDVLGGVPQLLVHRGAIGVLRQGDRLLRQDGPGAGIDVVRVVDGDPEDGVARADRRLDRTRSSPPREKRVVDAHDAEPGNRQDLLGQRPRPAIHDEHVEVESPQGVRDRRGRHRRHQDDSGRESDECGGQTRHARARVLVGRTVRVDARNHRHVARVQCRDVQDGEGVGVVGQQTRAGQQLVPSRK